MRIVAIGLGYVGLPLAAALSDHFETLGYEISASRIDELRSGRDRTGELSPERLAALRLHLSATHSCREPSWCTIMPGSARRGRLRRCAPRRCAARLRPCACKVSRTQL